MNEELELRDVCMESEGRLNIIIIIIVTLVTSDLNIRVKKPPPSWPPTPRLVGLEASTSLQSSSSTLSGEIKIKLDLRYNNVKP